MSIIKKKAIRRKEVSEPQNRRMDRRALKATHMQVYVGSPLFLTPSFCSCFSPFL